VDRGEERRTKKEKIEEEKEGGGKGPTGPSLSRGFWANSPLVDGLVKTLGKTQEPGVVLYWRVGVMLARTKTKLGRPGGSLQRKSKAKKSAGERIYCPLMKKPPLKLLRLLLASKTRLKDMGVKA